MRITSWNLLHGLAMPPDEEADAAALLSAEIDHLQSDVIGLQEVDYFLSRSGTLNQVGNVAAMMSTPYWAFAPSLMGSPDEDWRYPNESDERIVTDKTEGALPGYGIGLVSKIPVVSWHRLDLKGSPIGVPMTFPVDGKMKRFYVRDHPRSALGAVLDNGWLVINTHLSFVPLFNLFQIIKIKRWANTLGVTDKSKIIIMGDLNIPFAIFVRGFKWKSLAAQRTYPSWYPKVQIDYFLSQKLHPVDVRHIQYPHSGMSDHLPLQIEVDVN
ncbi:MAG: endonuclease/exonuclease/phosphatase family protein [Candidatus Planktophila sp.]|nr:endonuclease/exonuclease/phosphatase family protein [Candidatus Planktophila sp.]